MEGERLLCLAGPLEFESPFSPGAKLVDKQ